MTRESEQADGQIGADCNVASGGLARGDEKGGSGAEAPWGSYAVFPSTKRRRKSVSVLLCVCVCVCVCAGMMMMAV